MTGWIIFGSIVLLLIWLFTRSVTVIIDYENKLDIKVKFLFLTLYPAKPRKKKPKPEKKRAAAKEEKAPDSDGQEKSDKPPDGSGENTQNEAEKPAAQKGEKKSAPKGKKSGQKFAFDLGQIMEYVRSASPPVKRLFKKIRCYDLYIDYVVATDDAAKTAIKYGTICAFLYPVIEWLTSYFTVYAREVNVEADFSEEKDDVFAYCRIKLRVSTALSSALWLGTRLIKTYFKFKSEPRGERTQTARPG